MGRYRHERAPEIISQLGQRSIVLVGLMGCGKTTVGRRLANKLGIPFGDADVEIERAAQMTIPEIFDRHGEAYFRDGEKRVIARLLKSPPQVLATGGGAFMDADTREAVASAGVSVWLRASLDVLMDRVRRRNDRPLLKTPDPEAKMRALMDERHPVYGLSDICVETRDAAHDLVVGDVIESLDAHLGSAAR